MRWVFCCCLIVVLTWGCFPARAWEISPDGLILGRAGSPPGTFVLVDPERTSRPVLLQVARSGLVPLAPVRLTAFHPDRLAYLDLPKDMSLFPEKRQRGVIWRPVRFYLPAWRDLLRAHIQGLLEMGFGGVVFYGVEDLDRMSNHPFLQQEFIRLAEELAAVTKRHSPKAIVLGWVCPKTPADLEAFTSLDGAVLEGIWFNARGRPRPAWDREPFLPILRAWHAAGKRLLVLEPATEDRLSARVRSELHAVGADLGFGTRPHWMRR